MMPIPLRRLPIFSLLLLLSAAPALAEDWVVVKISGEAWISNSNEPVARAAAGMTVPDGSTFSTSHNARAQLDRGTESILVSPNTVITPQSYTFFGTSTTIQQQTGQIELEVEKRNVKHFSVRTPLLAAIVKGTHFTVSVSNRGADVQVARGLVEVSDLRTGSSADIGPGQKAVVGGPEGPSLRVSGATDHPDIWKGRSQNSEDEGTGTKGQSGSKAGTGNAPGGSGSAGGTSTGNNGGGKGNSGSTGANGNGGGKGNSGSGGSGSNAGGNSNGGGNVGGNNGNGNGNGGGAGVSGGNNAGGNGKGGGNSGSGSSGGGNAGGSNGGGKGNGNGNGGGTSNNGSGNGVSNGGGGGNSEGKGKR